MKHNDFPIVTFVLLAYNQEQIVAEAVHRAFEQTYSPVEIILSDDCSSDRTFQIMEEMAHAYRGPHTIILNRNSSNLGIGGHVNRVMELAQGEWIVVAAGDDLSLPGRTSRLMHVISTSDEYITAVFSSVTYFSDAGKEALEYPLIRQPITVESIISRSVVVSGFSFAWRKEIFNYFGPLHHDIVFEDFTISFRAALTGKILFVQEPLVQVRIVKGSAGRPASLEKKIRNYTYVLTSYAQMLIDLSRYLKDKPTEMKRVLQLSELIARYHRNYLIRISRHLNPNLLSLREHLLAWQDTEIRKHSVTHIATRVKRLLLAKLVSHRASQG